ncbi:DUF6471 domain-containing protein [Porcipelethomonas sp.]|uniref:helix-turn-helix domain-containing protein n=1 Tax=Porcipelethomonas sp. TaxID=2981675 RepID=UPI0030783206
MKGYHMTISEFIKLRLKEIGLTQSELANKLGISKQNMNNKLSRDNFSSMELCQIAEILNVEFIFKNETTEYKIKY